MPVLQVVAGSDTTYPTTGSALANNQTFQINQPFQYVSVSDDDNTFDGDQVVNETPDDLNQTININGQDLLVSYDYLFSATYNGVTYQFAVVDVDLNNDGNMGDGTLGGVDAGENVTFLAVLGPSVPTIPPGGAQFRVTNSVVDNTDQPFDTFICFAEGTLIDTPAGPKPVEALQEGDLVLTLDRGPQPLAWVGSREVLATGALAPVRIADGALGNKGDLRLSQQHRVLITGWHAELAFGEAEVLCPAVALAGRCEGVTIERGGSVRYFHLMLDRHDILMSQNLASESFRPADYAMRALDDAQRHEILTLFPELAIGNLSGWAAARPLLKPREVAAMLAA